jgi:N-formylglutamate amidohydrolase
VSVRTVEAGGAPLARVTVDESTPVIALALHAGHGLRPGLSEHVAVSEADRLREEDPFTAAFAPPECTLIEVVRSRFEVDLNRPRYRCVYQGPADAWGLKVWRDELPDAEDRTSRLVYDAFYAAAYEVLSRHADTHGQFVVLDLHSYNHRRGGPDAAPAPEADNPQVNLGTRRIDRVLWAPVVDALGEALASDGLHVAENVKFGGGHFAHWVEEQFPGTGCTLSLEFKKTYMDEWTGAPNEPAMRRITAALAAAVPLLEETLATVGKASVNSL